MNININKELNELKLEVEWLKNYLNRLIEINRKLIVHIEHKFNQETILNDFQVICNKIKLNTIEQLKSEIETIVSNIGR